MPFVDQLPNGATGTPRRRAASCPPTDAASLITSAWNSSVYCLLGSLPSFISILRTSEVINFLLYVKSRHGQSILPVGANDESSLTGTSGMLNASCAIRSLRMKTTPGCCFA